MRNEVDNQPAEDRMACWTAPEMYRLPHTSTTPIYHYASIGDVQSWGAIFSFSISLSALNLTLFAIIYLSKIYYNIFYYTWG